MADVAHTVKSPLRSVDVAVRVEEYAGLTTGERGLTKAIHRVMRRDEKRFKQNDDRTWELMPAAG